MKKTTEAYVNEFVLQNSNHGKVFMEERQECLQEVIYTIFYSGEENCYHRSDFLFPLVGLPDRPVPGIGPSIFKLRAKIISNCSNYAIKS